jgi:hypothetical protein
MGALSRRKGHSWERDVAARFRALGIAAERRLDEPRAGNQGDLLLPPGVPLVVQARVGARPGLWEALRDARAAPEASRPGVVAVGIVRRNGAGSRPPDDVAILSLDDFMGLVGLLREHGAWS